MSFLGGAECSTAANPLSQFTKHVQDDKTLQRDRLVGRGPGGLQESIRSQGIAVGSQDQMMNDFIQHSGQLPQGPGPASPFAMEQMRRELDQASHPSPVGQQQWASEFNPGLQENVIRHQSLRASTISPAEFASFQNPGAVREARTTSPPIMNGYQAPMGMGYGMGMNSMRMGAGMMPQSYSNLNTQRAEPQGKGKGRMIELDDNDWEAQFKELETNQADLNSLDEEAREAMERQLHDLDRSVLSETDEFGDFESIWKGIQAETAAARNLADELEEERYRDGLHIGDDFDRFEGFDSLNTHLPTQDPELGNYLFEQENPFKDLHDPFSEGMRIMEEGGNLSLAALAFEAAVQKDPQHVEAWTRLGGAQAQNEKESPAIRALEQAIKLDPSNLEALMGLAVSYTNEGYDSTAYRTLERWLATKYPSLIETPLSDGSDELGFTERHILQKRVTDLFIQAAQLSPSGESMDPDVQVGLGVLFYGAEEYDKAVDCFGAALQSTETGTTNRQDQLHLLWNRLGATLANSGHSEEAIDAYERALSLRPNFVRARYNLGVSCINIGCYEEAAQHLLGALAMHRVVEREGRERVRQVVGDTGGPDGKGVLDDSEVDRLVQQNQSTNLYDTLRRVFSQMNRRDLGDIVGPGMDVEAFRGEFDF
ncbi:MAG: Peroxisomal membrane signal receptor PTS1 [Bogoriella megaspora]|nr:MAG: Peroxisomal membrane signal receptor PTS1 [Bogoriella megaspora]